MRVRDVVLHVFCMCFLGTMPVCLSWLRSTSYAYHLRILVTFHGFNKDGIAVDFNQHHDVFVAALETCRELAHLVGEHGSVYLVCFNVHITYFLAMELRGFACFEWDRLFFGGAYVFPSLV